MQREELALTGPKGARLPVLHLGSDEPGPRPAVLVLGPVGDESVHEGAERIASAGYAVFLPQLDDSADRDALSALGVVLDALSRIDDVDAERVAVMGFGRGGTLAFLLGCTRRLAGVIDVEGAVLYPELSPARPIQPLELALNLEGDFLAFFAGASVLVSGNEIELLRARLSSAARPCDIVVYPGAQEGFHDRRRPGFDPACAEDLWRRVLAFLRANLQDDS